MGQKTKPLIVISLHEIAQTHRHLGEHLKKLAEDPEDPLRVILKDLGEIPVANSVDDDREVQLVLTNRFAEKMEEEISAATSLYVETKELVISALRVIPITDGDDINLVNILRAGKKHAKLKKNTALESQIKKIFENLKNLEGEGTVTKDDNYAEFLREIALEVANRAAVREQQKKEIKRLTTTLSNLRQHQDYLNTQIEQYQSYLQDCRVKQAAGKDKKVLVESDVPAVMRKKTDFFISSEAPGEFVVVCKMAGKKMGEETLELDTILEMHENGATRIDLDNVVLDVPMTLHLLNKY